MSCAVVRCRETFQREVLDPGIEAVSGTLADQGPNFFTAPAFDEQAEARAVSSEKLHPALARMREAVAQIGFHFRGKPVWVTVSCGITQLREGDADDDAFDRADKAMYRAKQGGRNRVVSA